MPGATITMVSPEGRSVDVPATDVAAVLRQGFRLEDESERVARLESKVVEERNSGLLNDVAAGAAGLARGATLGLSDVAVGAFGTADDVRQLRELREQNPDISLASELVGGVAPALVGGGGGALRTIARATPTGRLARVGTGIVEAGAARGGIAKAGSYLAAGALEGGAAGAGMYLSEVALGQKDLSAEGFVAATGSGALLGAAGGGVALGIEKGTISARRLLSRADDAIGEGAEEAAEHAAARETDSILEAGDDTARKARDLIRAEKLKKAQAATAREETRLAADRAAADQKLATQRALDEARIAKAQGRAPRAPAAPEVAPTPTESALASADEIAATAGGTWTEEALADSATLARMLGQTVDDPKLARLEAKVAELEDARGWVDRVRGGIAKKAGGKFEADVRAATAAEKGDPRFFHGFRTKLGGGIYGEAGEEIAREVSDDAIARGLIADQPDLAATYDDLITRAAVETDEVAKRALLKEAADFEEGLARGELAVPRDAEVLAARSRLGITGETIAAERAADRAAVLAGMAEADAMAYVRGIDRPFVPKPLGPRQAEDYAFDRALRGVDSPMGAAARDAREVPLSTGLRRVAGGPGELPGLADDLGLDAYEAIEVIGRYERTLAEVIEELPPAAVPAKAKEIADGYLGAVDDQARKVVERQAQAADDATEAAAGGIEKPAPKRSRRARAAGAMNKLADVGAAMEALQTAGIPGVPDVDAIPVIGPLLGLWLKTRAARKLLFGSGRVAANGESRVAAYAAKTRDRAAEAVDRLLAATGKAAQKGRGAVGAATPRVADALKNRLFDDGVKRGEPEDDVSATLDRIEELSNAVANPGAVRRAVRKALPDAADPDLIRAVEEVYARKLGYLAEHMPKSPPPTLLGDRAWRPSKSEIESFARRVRAAEDPVTVLEDLERGAVTEEAAETLRIVYPKLYAEAQGRLIARAAELEEDLPYQRVLRLAILFDAPLVESLLPENIASLQEIGSLADGAPAGATMAPTPSPAGLPRPPDLDRLYQTAADRRAMRR